MSGPVLIFPAGHPGGAEHRAQVLAEGGRVIGSSSLDNDPARETYDVWEKLPYVSAPNFAEALGAAIRKHGVSAVHAPHYVVWRHLSEKLAQIAPGVRLTGGATVRDQEQVYRDLRARLDGVDEAPFYAPALASRPPLPKAARTGLIRLANTIPGMSSDEKMLAMIDMMRCAPAGDIVEIGCWWGRSAALMVLLAHRFDLGNVLCVDPWSSEAVVQNDAILDEASATADMDEALRIFEIHLAPLAMGRLNYIRAPSAQGAARYGPGLRVETPAFGATHYTGQIAVLHIDGNHTAENAELDTQLWTPHVKPGGWIIFDDYFWVFGDGPREAGDRFLARNAERIQLSFVAGKAMFVQLKA